MMLEVGPDECFMTECPPDFVCAPRVHSRALDRDNLPSIPPTEYIRETSSICAFLRTIDARYRKRARHDVMF